jgi:hypothetical protein
MWKIAFKRHFQSYSNCSKIDWLIKHIFILEKNRNSQKWNPDKGNYYLKYLIYIFTFIMLNVITLFLYIEHQITIVRRNECQLTKLQLLMIHF